MASRYPNLDSYPRTKLGFYFNDLKAGAGAPWTLALDHCRLNRESGGRLKSAI
jgi:hypothetical protein